MGRKRNIAEVIDTQSTGDKREWICRFTGNATPISVPERSAQGLIDDNTVYTPVYLSAKIRLKVGDPMIKRHNTREFHKVIWRGFDHTGEELIAAHNVTHIGAELRAKINTTFYEERAGVVQMHIVHAF
jgi:hypothetical protein